MEKLLETLSPNVGMTLIICATVLILAIILAITFSIWHHMEIKAEDEITQKKNEQENIVRSIKQQADLQSRLLNHLETMTKNENADKIDENNSNKYISELKLLINPQNQNEEKA